MFAWALDLALGTDTENTQNSSDNDEESTMQELRKHPIQDFNKKIKNTFIKRAINLLEILGREGPRRGRS